MQTRRLWLLVLLNVSYRQYGAFAEYLIASPRALAPVPVSILLHERKWNTRP